MRTLILAIAATLVPSISSAQSACHPADYDGPKLRHYVSIVVSGKDNRSAASRERYDLAAADSSSVTVVTDSATCRAAALAYARQVEQDSTIATTTRRVHVVRTGNRYVVLDPADRSSGSWRTFVVFSLEWDALAVFAG